MNRTTAARLSGGTLPPTSRSDRIRSDRADIDCTAPSTKVWRSRAVISRQRWKSSAGRSGPVAFGGGVVSIAGFGASGAAGCVGISSGSSCARASAFEQSATARTRAARARGEAKRLIGVSSGPAPAPAGLRRCGSGGL